MALPASFGMIVVLDNLSSFPEFYSFVKKPNIPLASTKSCFPSLLSFQPSTIIGWVIWWITTFGELPAECLALGGKRSLVIYLGQSLFLFQEGLSSPYWFQLDSSSFQVDSKFVLSTQTQSFFLAPCQDRLTTRNILKRKNFDLQSFDCAHCTNNSEETMAHLFLNYDFAKSSYNIIGFQWPLCLTISKFLKTSKLNRMSRSS